MSADLFNTAGKINAFLLTNCALTDSMEFKTCVSAVVGVDAPAILQQIALNIPEKKAAEDDR